MVKGQWHSLRVENLLIWMGQSYLRCFTSRSGTSNFGLSHCCAVSRQCAGVEHAEVSTLHEVSRLELRHNCGKVLEIGQRPELAVLFINVHEFSVSSLQSLLFEKHIRSTWTWRASTNVHAYPRLWDAVFWKEQSIMTEKDCISTNKFVILVYKWS